ncbi:4-hydroxy-L-threonine phosphate dehydrogenase PdxA [Pseudomonas sp. BIGb0278]|nr:4-hydroxy-L-threonine phosphate dehydrogenase PdxA [Pseudomonas sp. BIGb0278]
MTQAGRLNKQPVRASFAQQPTQPNLKRHAIDAAQAATGNLSDGNAVFVTVQQRSVQANLTKLVDQHCPALIGRPLHKQMANQAGLAGA